MPAMTCSDLLIQRGCTFRKVVRWETSTFETAAIAAMTQAGIARVSTAAPHGIPDGWRVAVVGAVGMTELNAENNPPRGQDLRVAAVVSATDIEFNEISSAGFKPYRSGGFLKWYAPHDLVGYTARMDLVDAAGDVLMSLTSATGAIVVDSAEQLIELVLTDVATQALAFDAASYALELISPTGEVTPILAGAVRVVEVPEP